MKEMLEQHVRTALAAQSRDLSAAGQVAAAYSSWDFIDEVCSHVQSVESKEDVLKRAIEASRADYPLVLEFGVAGGYTLNLIGSFFPDVTVWGFDSFEGLPQSWRDGFPEKTFQGHLPQHSISSPRKKRESSIGPTASMA